MKFLPLFGFGPEQPDLLPLTERVASRPLVIVPFLGTGGRLCGLAHSLVGLTECVSKVRDKRDGCPGRLLGWSCDKCCWEEYLPSQHCHVWGDTGDFVHLILYAAINVSRRCGQLWGLSCTVVRSIYRSVRFRRSTWPSHCGWKAVVWDFWTPVRSHSS